MSPENARVFVCVCTSVSIPHDHMNTCIPFVSRYRVQSLSDSSHHPGTEEGGGKFNSCVGDCRHRMSTCLHRAGGAIRVSIPLDWNDKRSLKREVVSGGY